MKGLNKFLNFSCSFKSLSNTSFSSFKSLNFFKNSRYYFGGSSHGHDGRNHDNHNDHGHGHGHEKPFNESLNDPVFNRNSYNKTLEPSEKAPNEK
jgi:hypothetical protein